MTTQLEKFLNEPKNMHAREAILMHRLFFDVKLAAARRGYYLNSYFDDVDHDGFDVIFDDQDCIKKIQVKSVSTKSATQSWDIHKKMLRPSIYLIDTLGFEASQTGEGTEGGVVLIEFEDKSNSFDITYYYTDIFILMAFDCKIIKRSDGRSQKAVETCLEQLNVGLGYEKLHVPKAAFIRAKNIDSLLALVGLHSNTNTSWKHHVIQIANHKRQFADQSLELPMPMEKMCSSTSEELLELAEDDGLCV